MIFNAVDVYLRLRQRGICKHAEFRRAEKNREGMALKIRPERSHPQILVSSRN